MTTPEARRVGLPLFIRGMVLTAICLAAFHQGRGPARERPISPSEPGSRQEAAAVTRELPSGEAEEGKLSGAEPAVYRFSLDTGEYLHVTLEQYGVDAVVALLDPAGRKLFIVDSPVGQYGPEHLFFVAEQRSSYFLEVQPFEHGRGGRYAVLVERRPATTEDRIRAKACRAVSTADALIMRENLRAHRRALQWYREAIDQWRQVGEIQQEAMAQTKLGKALFGLGEIASSAQHLESGLALLEKLGSSSRQPALRNDLGIAYEHLGRFAHARACFEAAQTSARRMGNRREEIVAINNLGLLEQNSGEPWRALLLLDEALAGWRELEDTAGAAATLHNLGALYTVLGRLPEARNSLEQALSFYRRPGMDRNEAATLMALGWVRFLQGDVAGARAHLQHSLDLRRASGNRRGEAVTLDRLGTVSRETNELERAISEYRQAIEIFRKVGDPRSQAFTLSNLGETLALRGEPLAGLRHQNEALHLLKHRGGPSAEAYVRFRRAKAERTLGDRYAAWNDMQRAIPMLERIRERTESDDFRMTYFDSIHEHYEFAVDLLMELHERQPESGFDRLALDVAGRAQARGLLDLVDEARGSRAVERLGSRSGGLHQLEEEIRAAEQRQATLMAEGGRESAVAIEEDRIRRLLQDREKLLIELRLTRGDRSFAVRQIGTAEIQHRLLDQETMLLVYFLGARRSFVWAISDQSIETAVLPSREFIERAAMRLHTLLAKSNLRKTQQVDLTASELSNALLGKVARLLTGKRIAIVPDGALAYIPFSALPDPASGGLPLLVHHEVVILPSASVLAAIRARAASRPLPPKLLAVVADPVFGRDDPRLRSVGAQVGLARIPDSGRLPRRDLTRTTRSLGLRKLSRLPFSRQEADAILALVQPEQRLEVTDFAATPALVTGGRLASFRIVHFATHALIHPRYPELSGVVLSLFDQRGRPQPGFLRPYQILTTRMPADLVVLSACRTGLGQKMQGEGLVGLPHSFFHAGASRVIVSLWDINDETTSVLMKRFYWELLHKKRPPAAALHAAQLSMLGEPRWASPYHWAGFVLQGDWR